MTSGRRARDAVYREVRRLVRAGVSPAVAELLAPRALSQRRSGGRLRRLRAAEGRQVDTPPANA